MHWTSLRGQSEVDWAFRERDLSVKKEIFDSGAAGHHLNKPVTTVHELGGGFAHTTLDVAQDQGIDDRVDTLSMPLLIANNVGDPASQLKRCSACTLASKLMILRITAHAS